MKLVYMVLLSILALNWSYAQEFSIKGEVHDSTSQQPLSFANVVLKTQNDSLFRTAVTDSKGQFQLIKVPKGEYTLSISFIGFDNYSDSINLKDDLYLDKIFLLESSTNLDEVTIEAAADAYVVKEDTLEYNASAYKVPEGSELEEILKKMPGIEIKDGVITANGKKIEKILVDGKPFFGNQIQTALKDLPADFVKKIQIIDEKSEEAQFTGHDDGQRTPTLNVVSKPEKKKGRFGNIRSTLSPPGRYSLSGSIGFLKANSRYNINGSWNNLNGGEMFSLPITVEGMQMPAMNYFPSTSGGIGSEQRVNASYSTEIKEKLEISTSIGWNGSESITNTNISRQYIQASDEGRIYNQISNRERKTEGISASISAAYNPSKNNQFTFRQSFSANSSLSTNMLSGETFLNNQLLNSTNNSGYMKSEGISAGSSFGWRHKFKKVGRTLSFDLSNSFDQTEGADSVKSINIFTDGNIQQQRFDQVSQPDNSGINRALNISFSEKTGENSSLRLGYKASLSEEKSDNLLFDFDPNTDDYTDLDPLRSSQFTLRNHSNEVTAYYLFKVKKFNFFPKLRYKNVRITNDQSYPNQVDTENTFRGLNPGFSIYGANEKGMQFQLSADRSMMIPRAQQLQDVLDNSNPLFLRQGNPDLKSGFRNSLNINIIKIKEESGTYYNLQLNASTLENATTNFTIVGDGSNSPNGIQLPVGARYSRPVNISGAKNMNVRLGSSQKVFKEKWRFGASGNVSYNFSPQFLNEQIQSSNTMSYGGGIGLNSNFSEKLTIAFEVGPSFSTVKNSNPEQASSNYFSWNGSFNARWKIAAEFYVNSNINYNYNGGVNNLESFDRMIWSVSIGKKIWKERFDLNITANDILRQSTDQNRQVSSEFIENSSTELLRQVLRFSLSYKFNKFG